MARHGMPVVHGSAFGAVPLYLAGCGAVVFFRHASLRHVATPPGPGHRQLVRPEGRWRSFSAWLGRVVRSCRVVQAAVVSPVTSFQVLKRLAISLRYSSTWSR